MESLQELYASEIIPTEVEDKKIEKNVKIIDKYYFAHIFFFTMGLVHLLPWTFFVTANDYWMYKFRNTSLNHTDSDSRTYFQVEFATFMQISLQVSNVTFLVLTTIFGYKIYLKVRMIGTIFGVLLLFILCTAFILIDTDSWQTGFFAMTMLIIIAINAFNAIFGLSIYTVISLFPHIYLKTYLLGQGLAEMISSTLQIIALAIGFSTETSALIYFGLAIALIAIGLIMTLILVQTGYYKHQMQNFREGHKEKLMSFHEFKIISKKIYFELLSQLFLILSINSIHTSITSLVVSEYEGASDWNDLYFVPTITFLLSSTCSFLGRNVASFLKKNLGGRPLLIACFVRMIVFIPLIMLCNAKPRSHLPVVFPHDYQYILIIGSYGFTNGYLAPVCFFNIAKHVQEDELKHAYSILMNIMALYMAPTSFLGLLTTKLL